VNIKIFPGEDFLLKCSSFRHFLQRMQSLRASAFSSWSVSFIAPLCSLF
jgi:hypothetical protein